MTTRRDRLREAASREILDAARSLLVGGVAPAMSLRAIAREVGLVPAAIYRYFPNLGELTDALCVRFHDDARAALVAARDAAGDDALDRMAAVSRELRRWALAHRAEFGLMYGDAAVAPSGARRAAEARVATVFVADRPSLCRLWARLCGLVAMEAFGHLEFTGEDAATVFEAELAAIAREWQRQPA